MVLNGNCWVFVEEVSLAVMPTSNLQGQVFAPAKPAFFINTGTIRGGHAFTVSFEKPY